MKEGLTTKKEATAPQFEALLRGLVGRVPFLKLVSLKSHAKLSSDPHDRADLLARVLAGDRKWVLAVEKRTHGQPREVRTAVLQLERHLKRLPGDVAGYGVLLAPFLSEESAKICEEAGIGYADLAGNARLSFDQVFIETRSPENPFREKRETQSLFSPRATRVLRVLLQGPIRAWRVTDLAESARVSLGWVSAVRRQLLAREWAVAEPGGVRVTKPALVVEAWAKADEWEKRTQAQEYSVLIHEPLEVAEKLKEILPDEPPVFTQWFAAWLRHPYTTPAIVTAYVRRLPEDLLIQEKLLGRRLTDGGGRLRLVVPKDEGVLNPKQTVQGFQLVSDVQIYLDLQRAGLRAGEQAEELRRWPDFAGRLGMSKYGTFGEYLKDSLDSAQRALLTAWRSLERFHEDLVLVGGLAVHYLTKRTVADLPGAVTMDVDFGVSLAASGRQYGTIKSDLAGLGFKSEGQRLVRPFGGMNLYLDFLTEDPPSVTGGRMVDDVIASVILGVNRALSCRRKVTAKGLDLYGATKESEVAVADIGPLLVLKLNAFGGPTGRRLPKDAYDVLLAVTRFVDGPAAAVAGFRAEAKTGNTGFDFAMKALERDFLDPGQDGPVRAAEFHPGEHRKSGSNS